MTTAKEMLRNLNTKQVVQMAIASVGGLETWATLTSKQREKTVEMVRAVIAMHTK